jgi:hypothetical protein
VDKRDGRGLGFVGNVGRDVLGEVGGNMCTGGGGH